MNILVTGSNGQLGRELRIVAERSRDRYVFTDISELPGEETVMLDVTDAVAVRDIIGTNDIQVVINCAAYTDVEMAEENPELCRRLNACAPGNLASAVKDAGGLLVHISTDYVFGGEPYNTPCSEDMKEAPTGVYGITKLEGEQAVLASGCDSMIIRTSWLYSEFGRNFVKTVLALTADREELDVVFDQTGTPTYAYDLASAIYDIVENRMYAGRTGVYHYSNEGVCSWYDFAKMIAEYSGHSGCHIRPCHSHEYPGNVARPAYSVLDKTRIKKEFGISIPYWMDSLKVCIGNIQAGNGGQN